MTLQDPLEPVAVAGDVPVELAALRAETAALDEVRLASDVLALRRQLAELAAREAVLLAELERRRTGRPRRSAVGFDHAFSDPFLHRTTGLWLTAETRQAKKTCGGLVAQARDLQELPLVHAALLAGSITEQHVREILRAFRTRHMPDHVVEAQDRLVGWARTLPWEQFTRRIDALVEILDDEDPAEKALRLAERRGIWITEVDDLVSILIVTTREAKDQFLGAIEPRAERMKDADFAEARDRVGDDVSWSDVERSDPQRLHDAWLENTRAGADNGDSGVRPVVEVLVDVDTLEREAARLDGALDPLGTDEALDAAENSLCESMRGTPYNPALALVLALSTAGRLRRAVIGAPDGSVDLSPDVRLHRGDKRTAVRIRDRVCAMPGCDHPAHLCEIDHIVPYEAGGPTTTANGQPLCRPCHRWKSLLDRLGYPPPAGSPAERDR